MKKMNLLVILSLGCVLSACGSDDSKKSSDSTKTITQSDMKDATDTSSCVGEAPAGATYEGTFRAIQRSSDGMTSEFIVKLQGHQSTLTSTCDLGGAHVENEVHSRIKVDASTIEFLDSDTKENESTVGSSHVKCSVNIKPMKVAYTLVGQCLQVTDSSGGKSLMVRSN